jgi:hypothetical protein
MVDPYSCIGFIASAVVCCRAAPHHPPEYGCRSGARTCCCRASHCACVSTRPLPAGCRSARCVPRLRLCANCECKRDCDDECSPHFSFPPCFYGRELARRSTSALTKNAESFFAALVGPSTSFRTNGKATVLPEKANRPEKRLPFFFGYGLLSCREVRVIRELMTVHNGGCHEGIRSRISDVRYPCSGVFSC